MSLRSGLIRRMPLVLGLLGGLALGGCNAESTSLNVPPGGEPGGGTGGSNDDGGGGTGGGDDGGTGTGGDDGGGGGGGDDDGGSGGPDLLSNADLSTPATCTPGSTLACYTGPTGTLNIGICKAGSKTCQADGKSYGACGGQVAPAASDGCNHLDDNCNGKVDEGCSDNCTTFYSESFDDGRADEITTGPHKLRWCNAYVPVSTNTPPCMSGRTMRVNSSTDHRGVWVTRGLESCTSVDVSYTFYQFANSQVSLKYKGANDDFPTCPSVAVTSTVSAHSGLQTCTTVTKNIPFGTYRSLYIMWEAAAGNGDVALWIDNLSIRLNGCSC